MIEAGVISVMPPESIRSSGGDLSTVQSWPAYKSRRLPGARICRPGAILLKYFEAVYQGESKAPTQAQASDRVENHLTDMQSSHIVAG